MKSTWILILLFSISIQLIGQDKNSLNTMIASSLNSYISNDKDLAFKGINLMYTSHYFICMDGLPSYFSIDSIKNATFFSLINLEGLPKSFKNKLKKGIKALFVNINLLENQLIVTVSGRIVKYKKKENIDIIVEDWSIYIYKYSCEKQKWLFLKNEYGGV